MKATWALALASTIISALHAIPADAAALNRTYVSRSGSDSNPCTITSPCASFQAALNTTAAGGEFDCLDAGDFGYFGESGNIGIVIAQAVSIVCDGANKGTILTIGGNWGVTVGSPSGSVVNLTGLDINGLSGSGDLGVNVMSGATVYIVNTTVHGFMTGVAVQSPTNPARVILKNSKVVNNGTGVSVVTASPMNDLIIENSVIDGNSNIAAHGGGPNAVLALTQTLLTGSPAGLQMVGNSSAVSIGPSNVIAGAITGTTSSVAFK